MTPLYKPEPRSDEGKRIEKRRIKKTIQNKMVYFKRSKERSLEVN